jgi:hypothetical protein
MKQKVALKDKHLKQINGKFNYISSTDENKNISTSELTVTVLSSVYCTLQMWLLVF